MAVLFMDGCDHLDTGSLGTKWTTPAGYQVFPGEGKFGGGALAGTSGGGAGATLQITPTTLKTGLVSYWLKGADTSTAGTTTDKMAMDLRVHGATTNDLIGFGFVNGKLRVTKGTPATGELGVSTAVVEVAGTWTHLEYRWSIATKGEIEVRANGIVVLLLSSVNLGNTAWTKLQFGAFSPERHDDIVVQDGPPFLAVPGATNVGHRIYTLRPNAAGAVSDWTGTYADVDDATFNGDADYLASRAAGKTHAVGLEDLSNAAIATITAVQLNAEARRLSATGTAPTFRQSLHPTTGSVAGTLKTPTTAYVNYRDVWMTAVGAPITRDLINGAEVEIVRVG